MKLDTAWGCDGTDPVTVRKGMLTLESALGGAPDLVFFHGAQDCNPRAIVEALTNRWPNARIHGASSSRGVMMRNHFHADPRSFGFLAIADANGAYGVGCSALGTRPREAVKRALGFALGQAGRPDETPAMILLAAPPGTEEELLAGLADVVGAHVPVAGGSAADETAVGKWWLVANGVVDNQSVVVTVLYPSGGVFSSMHCAYEATGFHGRVTRVSGRIVHEIDGRPAVKVYNEWTGGAIAGIVDGGKMPQETSIAYPLGRRVGSPGDTAEYLLSLPDKVFPDGSLSFLTELNEREQLWLMHGVDDVVKHTVHAASISLDALRHKRVQDLVLGALVMHSAAAGAVIGNRMPELVAGIDAALGDRPYFGCFTFGEQGRLPAGTNRHGNLMTTVVFFTQQSS